MDPTTLVAIAVAAAALAALYVSSRRAVTIAELDVRAGAVRVVRGGIAPGVLVDVQDVASRPRIDALRIRILRSSGRAEVELAGNISADQAQRLRNVIGSVPLARLANARRRR